MGDARRGWVERQLAMSEQSINHTKAHWATRAVEGGAAQQQVEGEPRTSGQRSLSTPEAQQVECAVQMQDGSRVVLMGREGDRRVCRSGITSHGGWRVTWR